MATAKPFPFLHLPAEIREHVYRYLVVPSEPRQDGEGYLWRRYPHLLDLFLVNRLIFSESRKIFQQENIFVKIETPFAQAQQHVAVENHVPVVCTGTHAAKFRDTHLDATIDAPQYAPDHFEPTILVLLVEELDAFCKIWYYTDLSSSGMNAHLRLQLYFKDPYAEKDGIKDKVVPKAIQQQLFEPFGQIKGLFDMQIHGSPNPTVVQAVKDVMAIPYPSPQSCLEESTRLKDEGNVFIGQGKFQQALDCYFAAFHAMFITVNGRERRVWGDAYFEDIISDGMYKNTHGRWVRISLRVKLVANVIQAYLKMEQFEEARFWGMRTINLIREQMGGDDDESMVDFDAAREVGKIYYRTGVAWKALGDESEARKLLRVATKYLPNDEIVRKELASVALRLG